MKPVLLSAAVLHGVFALVLVSLGPSPLLTLTLRRQFDNWTPLLDYFRFTPQSQLNTSSAVRDGALALAWCNVTIPPNTTRAPFCDCVSRVSAKFFNATVASNTSLDGARSSAATDLVGCLSSRPVWKVFPLWNIRFYIPAVYALFVSFCFLFVAAEVDFRFPTAPLWALGFALIVAVLVHDLTHNSFWSFTLIMVLLVVEWVLIPALEKKSGVGEEVTPLVDSPGEEYASGLQRTPSCFWWSEYLVAPVYALYVPLMHCGRDFYFVCAFTMIGTAVGGLGLRSFWCYKAYDKEPRSQFQSLMQYVVWLGILASCVSLSFITGIYYNPQAPYVMGAGSVALMVLTFVVSLLQWPGSQSMESLLFTQMSVAVVRNVILFGLVIADVVKK